jgi:hypothetical protein
MAINNFNEKPHFPFTYGDEVETDGKKLSIYIVNKLKEKRVQSYIGAVAIALLTLGSQAKPTNAIPPEYGEAANEMLNQAAQNGAAAAGGVPQVPPIGKIQGQMPVAPGNPQNVLYAMPIEQQRIIAAQQTGRMGPVPGMPNMPKGSPMGQGGPPGPSNPPSFYIPGKPVLVITRGVNTLAFTTAMGVICLNAAWGEPVAILMCSSGLVGVAYRLGKEVVVFMAKNMQ